MKSRLGCFLKGVCIVAILFAIGLVVTVFAVRHYANKLVEDYTSPIPAQLPKAYFSPAEIQALEVKLDHFKEAFSKSQPAELTLTDEELNAMINHSEQFKKLKDHVHATIEDGKLVFQTSLPMKEFVDFPILNELQGRYLNSKGEIELGKAADGNLQWAFRSMTANGQPVPEKLMSIKNQKRIFDVIGNRFDTNQLSRLSEFSLEKGKMLLKTR